MFRDRLHGRWLIGALSASLATVTYSDLAVAGVKDTAAEEATCKDIGFRPKTASFADCVLELLSRKEAGGQAVASAPSSPSRTISRSSRSKSSPNKSEPVVEVALTPNEQTCAGYGFKKGTTQFGQCLMQLDDAQRQAELQQQQYNLQLAQYQQQVSIYNAQQKAIKEEKERRKNRYMMELGLRMMGGQSFSDASLEMNGLGNLIPKPIEPQPPAFQNYTIRTPSGNQIYCNYNVAASYMSCR